MDAERWRLTSRERTDLALIALVVVVIVVAVPLSTYLVFVGSTDPANPFSVFGAAAVALLYAATAAAGINAIVVGWMLYALLRVGSVVRGAATSGEAVVNVRVLDTAPTRAEGPEELREVLPAGDAGIVTLPSSWAGKRVLVTEARDEPKVQ